MLHVHAVVGLAEVPNAFSCRSQQCELLRGQKPTLVQCGLQCWVHWSIVVVHVTSIFGITSVLLGQVEVNVFLR